MKRFLLVFLALAVSLPRTAGQQTTEIVQRLAIDGGLSNNFVVSLDIDRYGAIWIGTEEGMNRFDGVTVRSYMASSGAIPGNGLNQVISDPEADAVWIASQRSGLSRYEYLSGRSEVFLPDGSPEGIASNEITHLEQDRDGRLWVSTYMGGLDCYDPATGSFTHYNSANVEGMLDVRIHCFTLGADGKIYIGHYGEGVTILDPRTRTASRFERESSNLPSNIIGCVYRDPDNNIWFGTMEGLALWRPVSQDFLVFDEQNAGLPRGEVFSMLVTRDRKLVVSPDYEGVWTADLDALSEHPSFRRMDQAGQMSNIGIHAMCEDRFGNLWLGSYGRGVLFIGRQKRPFSAILYPDPLSEHSVTAVAFTPEGDLAVGMEGGRIDILDRNFERKNDPRALNTGQSILSATIDTDGRLWVGSFLGGTRMYASNGRLLKELPVREARCFLQQDGWMWIASGGGLYLTDRRTGEVLQRYYSEDILPETWLRSLALDPRGRLWVGTFGAGIVVLQPSSRPDSLKKVAEFKTAGPSASNMVNALLADERGWMWAGTGAGLTRYDLGGELPVPDSTFSVRTSPRSDFIRALAKDAGGHIWLSTNLSVCRIDPADGSLTEYSYRNHTAPGNYQNGAVSCRNDGYLCFGTTDGITGFFPEEIGRERDTVSVHFSELNVFTSLSPDDDGQTLFLCGREGIELDHRQNSFSISFAADDYGLASQAEFSYRMNPGGNWYPVEDNLRLNFRQLPPGRYLLQVRARLINGSWSDNPATLQIRITPPWWQSTLAKILFGVLLLGILMLILLLFTVWVRRKNELRQERLSAQMAQEANEERLRFYTNITHELRTPLTLILSPAEDLKNDPALPERARGKVKLLLQNANRLLDLVNSLLNFRKAETNKLEIHAAYGNLSAMVEGIGRVFAEANVREQTRIRLDVEPGILAEFDPDAVTSILSNLLSNAIKYTPSGQVVLGLHPDAGGTQVEISVSDTGCGIARQEQEKIFEPYYQIRGDHPAQGTGIGLSLVRKLVDLAGWKIRLESEPGKGSVFIVSLPWTSGVRLEESTGEERQPESPDTEAKPILVIVEDNEDIRNYVRETLSDRYTVLQARDGEEGWSLILRTVPDLVISDIMMPVTDGIELCRRIRQEVQVSHIPVILLTAKDSMESRSEGYDVGADSYLTKPFTGSMLRSRIHNLLESRRRLTDRFGSLIQEPRADGPLPFLAIDNDFIRKVTDLVEENLSSEDLDVGSLAGQLNMSASTLYRKMKALTGLSTNEFIRKIRMRKAAEMLSSGNFNVSETAWNIGINSLIYFRQCFKEEYGCSPSVYRKRAAGKET